MTDVPELILGLSDSGDGGVIVAEDTEHGDLASLLAEWPVLLGAAEPLALAVNQFAQGLAFEVIVNPDAYRAEIEAEVAGDDLSQPWTQRETRVSDFGLPDFDEIAAPRIEGGTLVFFAADDLTRLPYRVEVAVDPAAMAAPEYDPLELTPVERDAAPVMPEIGGEPEEEIAAGREAPDPFKEPPAGAVPAEAEDDASDDDDDDGDDEPLTEADFADDADDEDL